MHETILIFFFFNDYVLIFTYFYFHENLENS